MHTVNRQGLQIEQCENCRGIFLDHGEMEQMVAAEGRYYGGGGGQYVPPAGGHRGKPDSPRPFRGEHYSDSPRPYRGDQHGGHYQDSPRPYGGHRKQKSFLSDLFD
jgi:Zn-finger nucleic acid-binding protein